MKRFNLIITTILFIAIETSMAQCPTDIDFYNQEQIDNFSNAYPGCTDIPGNVDIHEANIFNLLGLSALTSIGGDLEIFALESLPNLSGLDNLHSVGGDFNMHYNKGLASLTGLQNLHSIGGDFYIYDCRSLTDLTGLDQLSAIGNDFWIDSNDSLLNLNGLNNLDSINGNLLVHNNEKLLSLIGLDSLYKINGSLDIIDNWKLIELTGLNNLNDIRKELNIKNNYSLLNLTGLEGLLSIDKSLHIEFDTALITLSGLEHLQTLGGDLIVYSNQSLTFCATEPICNIIASPSGNVIFESNSIGCDSLQEVENVCANPLIGTTTRDLDVSIVPNPAQEMALLYYHLEGKSDCEIHIINSQGVMVRYFKTSQPNGQLASPLNLERLNQGMYWVQIVTEEGRATIKLVIR